jgi:hypothetical protein
MVVVRKQKFMVNNQFSLKKITQLYPEQKYFDFNGNTDAMAVCVEHGNH